MTELEKVSIAIKLLREVAESRSDFFYSKFRGIANEAASEREKLWSRRAVEESIATAYTSKFQQGD
jgi:hypothetical protein